MLTRRRTLLLAAAAGVSAGLAASRVWPAAPGRVVIAGGDLTEIAFALGAGGAVVGADTTASWPPETEALPKIGYMRRLSAEGVLSLRPDLLILGEGAGPDAAIAQLEAAGVGIARAPGGEGVETVAPKIAFMGETLGRAAEAEALISRFEAEMTALQAALAPIETRPSVLFLISAGRGAPMAAGENTAAAAIVALAKGRNAVTGYEGYKPLSAEAAIAAAPEVLLVPAHAVDLLGGTDAVLARPEIAATPAGQGRRVIVMDGLKLLGFGPRTPEAAAELARALHPAHAAEIVL
jgi:iron complex transport system substrate-binding protein